MPQMSPLMWMILMISNIMLLYMMISLMYYSEFKIHSKSQQNLYNMMKWKFKY